MVETAHVKREGRLGKRGDAEQVDRGLARRDVAVFRLSSTFRRRRGSYLVLMVLVALLGGVAIAAVAGARRTQSSYSTFLAGTNPSDLMLGTAQYAPDQGSDAGYDPTVVNEIRRLPLVKHAESMADLDAFPLHADGTLDNISVPTNGSVDGLFLNQDRVTVTQGRMPDPTRPDEMVMSADIARHFHLHPGSLMPWGFYRNADNAGLGISTASERPYLRVNMRVVGIGVLNFTLVEDDADAAQSLFVLFTPALTRQLTACCTQNSTTAIQLVHGSRDVPAVEASLEQLHRGATANANVPSISWAKTNRAIKPQSITLAAFGAIAAVAALLIGAQLVGRVLRANEDDLAVLRALGASPTDLVLDGLIGAGVAVVIGAIGAGVVAVALSPLAPIGPVRPFLASGIDADWTVLGVGVVAIVGVLLVAAYVQAVRMAPHRVESGSQRIRRSIALRVATAAGLPVALVAGIRLVFGRARGTDVPMRSAILGATLAIAVLVTTATFGSSLHTLLSRPALYGWNWNYELTGGASVGAIPEKQAARLLRGDRDVTTWSPIYFAAYYIDGQQVPTLGGQPGAPVGLALLSGRAPVGDHEIVVGADTLARLHKRLGDLVRLRTSSTTVTGLRIVGTATMPTMGPTGSIHPTMGDGVLISASLMPATDKDLVGNIPPGPEAILVRLRSTASPASALHRLRQIAAKLTLPSNYGVGVMSVQRPAEIINSRATSRTPLYLGAALAVGATAALGLTLIASVRRRRFDLALLKTLGFTRPQVGAAVASQATIAVGLGAAVGIPLGLVLGRSLWIAFAHEIHAVPRPTIPTSTVALTAVAALILANLIAAIPARTAANTPTSTLLRMD